VDLSSIEDPGLKTVVTVFQCDGSRVEFLVNSPDGVEQEIPLEVGDRILTILVPVAVTPTP
jgi:hypothetical protein